jgi:hypothetical protein
MKNFRKITRILMIMQFIAAIALTFMMVKAMKVMVVLMKGQGHF